MYCASIRTTIMLLSVLTLTQTTSLFATEIDHRKMRRDLDIAEEALKRIVQYQAPNIKSPARLEADQIRSAYIKDYGIVFVINASTAGKIFKIGDRVKLRIKKVEDQNHTTARTKKIDAPFTEDGKKTRLTEFFQTYAQTIGQLKEAENITVVLNTEIKVFRVGQMMSDVINASGNKTNHILHQNTNTAKTKSDTLSVTDNDTLVTKKHIIKEGSRVRVRLVTPDSVGISDPVHFNLNQNAQKNSNRSILYASVRKRDINAYQKGSLSDPNFNSKIDFQTLSADTTMIKKIHIFSGILDNSWDTNQGTPLNINNQTLGTYIPNLGAFFYTTNNQEAHLHTDDPITLKNTLIETLADYGSTLRDLKPNEEVIIHVHTEYPQYAFHHAVARARVIKEGIYQVEDFTKSIPNEFPENLILCVQKKHLTNYTMGKITLEQLREKIIVTDH